MKQFYLLDLDRCLLDTNALHMVFDEIVRSMSVLDVNDIIQAKKLVEETSGGSFDTAEFVREELKRLGRSHKWQEIEDNFVNASKNYDYLMPGAKELLELLRSRGENYGIITYGGQIWQAVKIRAAQIGDVPHLITDKKDKGFQIAAWMRDGRVPDILGGNEFDEITFVDDKIISFNGFPPSAARGFQVRTGNDLVVNAAELPQNVVSVESLYDVIRIITKDNIQKVE